MANRRGTEVETERTEPNSRARACVTTPIPRSRSPVEKAAAPGRACRRPHVALARLRPRCGRPQSAVGPPRRLAAGLLLREAAGTPPGYCCCCGRPRLRRRVAWPPGCCCCGRPQGRRRVAWPPGCSYGRPPGRRRGRAAGAAGTLLPRPTGTGAFRFN